MSRVSVFTTFSVVTGIAVVRVLPPAWLGAVAKIGGCCAAISAVIVRIGTKTRPLTDAKASVLMLLNLPEEPFAKVKEGWALTLFFTSAAFLISLMLAVIVIASI